MNLFKAFSIYALSSFLISGISFFLLPIFTHYLSPQDYGSLGLITTTIALLNPLIGLSSYGSIQAQYFKIGRKEIGSFTWSALVNNFIAFLIVVVVMLIVFPLIGNQYKISFLWFMLVPIITFFNIIPQTALTLYQTDKKPFQYALFSIFQAVLNLGLGLFFVVSLKWSWEGRGYSLLITSLVCSICGIYLLMRNNFLSFQYNRKFAKEALVFGLPLIPHSIGAFLIDSSDRYFIAGLSGTKDLGYYNIAYQICFLIAVADMAFNQSYIPFLYERLSEKSPESNRKIVRLVIRYVLVLALGIVALILVSPFFFNYFLDSNYREGLRFIPGLAASYFFLALYKLFAGFIFYHNKTVYLTYLSFINIALNILLNIILINRFGAIGAAIATLISCIVTAFVTYLFSQKVHPFRWL